MGVQKRQALKIRSCTDQITELNAQISDLKQRLDESNRSKPSFGEQSTLSATQVTLKPSATVTSKTEVNTDGIKNILKRCADRVDELLLAKKAKQ